MRFLEYLFFKYYNWQIKVGNGDMSSFLFVFIAVPLKRVKSSILFSFIAFIILNIEIFIKII